MIQKVQTPFQNFALVCRKCSKKLDGGFGPGGDEKLAKALRQGLKAAGRRRDVRIMEVGSFGLCPKKAVTVASSVSPGMLLVVERGTDIRTVAAALTPSGVLA